MQANELSYLPGYYVCECGESYLSDFPFTEVHCPCGRDLERIDITEDELNGILYNMDIFERCDNAEGYTWGQAGEFLHYIDHNRLRMLIEFLQKNNYLSCKITTKRITGISVNEKEVRVRKE